MLHLGYACCGLLYVRYCYTALSLQLGYTYFTLMIHLGFGQEQSTQRCWPRRFAPMESKSSPGEENSKTRPSENDSPGHCGSPGGSGRCTCADRCAATASATVVAAASAAAAAATVRQWPKQVTAASRARRRRRTHSAGRGKTTASLALGFTSIPDCSARR